MINSFSTNNCGINSILFKKKIIVNWFRLCRNGHLLLQTKWKVVDSTKFILSFDGDHLSNWNIFTADFLLIFIDQKWCRRRNNLCKPKQYFPWLFLFSNWINSLRWCSVLEDLKECLILVVLGAYLPHDCWYFPFDFIHLHDRSNARLLSQCRIL